MDISKEQVFTHVKVKTEYSGVLWSIAKKRKKATFFSDGLYFTNADADISTNPDGMYIANKSLETGRVRLIEGADEGFVEIEGSPDMVLEIVSDSSEEKDFDQLRQAYWEAGVREYWLVDVRKELLRFEILRHGSKGLVSVRKQAGWLRSSVFGAAFRLSVTKNALGHPDYHLAYRD